jgi:hypothetical protein
VSWHPTILRPKRRCQPGRSGGTQDRPRYPLITCLGAILAVAVPPSASQAMHRNRTIRIGSCRISGDFATCEASGSVNNPIRNKVHVKAVPNQRPAAR